MLQKLTYTPILNTELLIITVLRRDAFIGSIWTNDH